MVWVGPVPCPRAVRPPRGAMPWRPCLRQCPACTLLFDRIAICCRIAEVEDSADWRNPELNWYAASDDLRGGFPR